MDVYLQAISTVGFPIAVAVWAMVTSKKDREWLQDTLTKELESMTTAMHQMSASLDKALDEFKKGE